MAMPEAQRSAIQADLTWLGYFDGMSAEEVDGHTADAIKAFQRRNSGKETGFAQRSGARATGRGREAASDEVSLALDRR